MEKIVEIIKEIKEEDCNCLTGVKFINVWNKLFHIEGNGGTECMTEDEFVGLISKNFVRNQIKDSFKFGESPDKMYATSASSTFARTSFNE